jgi:hypothetical protein
MLRPPSVVTIPWVLPGHRVIQCRHLENAIL